LVGRRANGVQWCAARCPASTSSPKSAVGSRHTECAWFAPRCVLSHSGRSCGPARGSSAARRARWDRLMPGAPHRAWRRRHTAAGATPTAGRGRGRCRGGRAACPSAPRPVAQRRRPSGRGVGDGGVVGVAVPGGIVDGVAQLLQPGLLDGVGEPLVAPDPCQGNHPVALGDPDAVGGIDVGGGLREQHGALRQLRRQ